MQQRGRRRDVHRATTPTCSTATTTGAASTSPRATRSSGNRTPPTSAARRTSTACPPSRSRCSDIDGARVLAKLGDSVTTDHISPAGAIKATAPAGLYLTEHGIERADFNSYGSRRGNHEVMIRGTFANIRLRNQLAPGTEGGVTVQATARRCRSTTPPASYIEEGTPLIVLGGKEYGSGSSRDWAAKGTALLGVRAVLVGVVRAHPPLQPDRHGRAAAPVQAGRESPSRSALPARRSSPSRESPRSTTEKLSRTRSW